MACALVEYRCPSYRYNQDEKDCSARTFCIAARTCHITAMMSALLQIKNMSERDLAKYWSNYVKELAVLLVAVEGNDSPPAEVVERIQVLVQRELLFLYIRWAAGSKRSNQPECQQPCTSLVH